MAMGITQALKLQQGPIDALAKLPQQELISMVQQGRLGADILPIVLNEKAQMAQQAANMQAAQRPTPPSVTEQNMMINAQADAQQKAQAQQAQQMQLAQLARLSRQPRDSGIANLPMSEDMYSEQSLAGGGIVAFDEGGQAKSDSTADQIEQLYAKELGRKSDPEGYRFWSEKFGPEVTADERALFITEAAPEVQRRIAAGETNLPEYMRVDPAVRWALQSKDIDTDQYKKLANYFGNQWIAGEAEDPASLTRRDYIERPRSGYDLATFLATRSQQHGAQADTQRRMANLMAPYLGATGETRSADDEGAGGRYIINPITRETELATPLGVDNLYRSYKKPHHSTIGDETNRYAVGMDYRVDPETGQAYYVGPYTNPYTDRGHNDWQGPLGILGLAAGAYFGGAEGLLRSLATSAVTNKAKGGEIRSYAGNTDGSFVEESPGFFTLASESDPEGFTDYLKKMQGLKNLLPGMAAYESQLADEAKFQQAYRDRTAKEAEQNKWMRLAEAGLGIMGGTSPYALTNIGQGSQAALKGYAEDVKEQRRQELAARQANLALAKQQYDIGMGELTGALGMRREARAEERATAERLSREEIHRLDRENRMAIAQIPDKALQVAAQLRKDNPGLSYLDSVSQASQALTPRDTYNATRNAVSAAAKDAKAEFAQRFLVDSKLQKDVAAANAGDKAALERVNAIRKKIEEDTFRLYQVEGVSLSGGRMGATGGNEPRVVDFSQLPSTKK